MKISKILSAVCLFQIVTTTSLLATPTLKLQGGPYQNGDGGEFTATILDGGTSGFADGYNFQTFCMEYGEHLSFGTTYNFEINTAAVLGGQLASDDLDSRTAYLYNEFLNDTLVGYDTSSDAARLASAGRLQTTIWALEDEVDDHGNLFVADPIFLADADLHDPGTIGDIRILNLTRASDGMRAQDVIVRTMPAAVPAPGALLLSGLGTMVAGYLRKRRAL